MCLDIKYSKEAIRQLPKEFTAYKVVMKRGVSFYPPLWKTGITIQKRNVLPTMSSYVNARGAGRYRPYYHAFRTKAACNAVAASVVDRQDSAPWKYIRIRIKRKDVTCVGEQGARKGPKYQVIVSRVFSTDFEEYIPSQGA